MFIERILIVMVGPTNSNHIDPPMDEKTEIG